VYYYHDHYYACYSHGHYYHRQGWQTGLYSYY
jgi:hypothetical protein